MKLAALIQARLGSTRLPGKILEDISGQPMLTRVVRRALQIPGVDHVFVICPKADAEVLRHVSPVNVLGFPGDPNDVLARYDWAASRVDADIIVRITADCPCLDPELAGDVLKTYLRYGRSDVLADNVADNTDGFDTQVFGARLLRLAHLQATDSDDREHVCPWMERYALRARVAVANACPKLSVDTEEDLQRVRRVYEYLGKDVFTRQEALEALRAIG